MARLVVIDDEQSILNVLSGMLAADGYDVSTISAGPDLLTQLEAEEADLVVTDLRMEPIDGMEVLEWLKANRPDCPSILLTGFASVEVATQALSLGVFDLIAKPFRIDVLLEAIEHALEYGRTHAGATTDMRAVLGASYRYNDLIAESAAMHTVCDMIDRVSSLDMPVLIQGEKGSGKGLVAQELHDSGARQHASMITIDCEKGMSELKRLADAGVTEAGSEGTVHFRNVDALNAGMQENLAKILDVIKDQAEQRGESGIRILSSSDKDLRAMVDEGSFNRDLYSRLIVLSIETPPLRQRLEDIPFIAYHFIREECPTDTAIPILDGAAVDVLTAYDWPGNLNELREVMTHALGSYKGSQIDVGDLPEAIVTKARSAAEGDSAAAATEDFRGVHLKAFLRDAMAKQG